ncbi:MAG: endonuclease III [Candidatus Aenigmatarchaeota archaeon]
MNSRHKMKIIIREFKRRYGPKPTHGRPFETLIETIISQRNTDVSTAKVAKKLFSVARTPEALSALPMRKLQSILRPAGTWRQKACYIRQVSNIILNRYNGKVPKERQKLIDLPGVGPKTADIVLMYGHGIPSIAIDTHCDRIPRRLGLVPKDAKMREIKEALERLTPKREWRIVNHGFVSFGQEMCRAANPRCACCPFLRFCPFGKEMVKRLKPQR